MFRLEITKQSPTLEMGRPSVSSTSLLSPTVLAVPALATMALATQHLNAQAKVELLLALVHPHLVFAAFST